MMQTGGAKHMHGQNVVGLRFRKSGYFWGCFDVIIKKNDQGASAHVYHSRSRERTFYEKDVPITQDQWEQIVTKLYDQIGVQEWEKEYNYRHILDGMQWEFVITAEDGVQHKYSGSNDYPPRWSELVAIFNEFDEGPVTPSERLDPEKFLREHIERLNT